MELAELTTRGFSELLASDAPAPGGGSAAALEGALDTRSKELEAKALEDRLKAEALDITVPGKAVKRGHRHPMYIALDEMKDILKEHVGFVKSMWCGDRACEDKLKDELGVTSRCIPFEQEHVGDTCVCCGKPATKMLYWGKAY